jgi:outer membrane pore protein F
MRYFNSWVNIVLVSLLCAFTVNAAEVYNKDSNKVNIYGKVDVRNVISKNDSESGDASYARLGLKGQTAISDNLTGFGQWEQNMKLNKSESGTDVQNATATRIGFAGLNSNYFGSVDYGRNMGILNDANSFTDMAPVYGANTLMASDSFMTQRSTGVLTWRLPSVWGMKFSSQYQGKNERTDVTKSNGDGAGFSLVYTVSDSVKVAGAFSRSDRTSLQKKDGLGNNADAWVTSIKYDDSRWYLAAVYSQTKNISSYGKSQFAKTTHNLEMIGQYQFLNGLRPSVTFVTSKGKNLAGYGEFSGGDVTLKKYLGVGAYYYFNKNMTTYIDYKINLLKDDTFSKAASISTDDLLAIGLIYQF